MGFDVAVCEKFSLFIIIKFWKLNNKIKFVISLTINLFVGLIVGSNTSKNAPACRGHRVSSASFCVFEYV